MFSVISKNTGLSLKACETLYNKLIIIIERTLEYESTIDISDFGVFETRYRNEDMQSRLQFLEVDSQRRVPIFIPSKEFVAQLNDLEVKPQNVSKHELRCKSDSTYEINLKAQSKLGALGYSIKLSRDERWRILIEKAIPLFGMKSVESHILWLIKLKKKDRHRDYRSALFEWEYDLKRLRELNLKY